MVIADSNIDEKGWAKFWVWKVSLGRRLGPSRTDLIDGSVEKGWDEQLKSSRMLNDSYLAFDYLFIIVVLR